MKTSDFLLFLIFIGCLFRSHDWKLSAKWNNAVNGRLREIYICTKCGKGKDVLYPIPPITQETL